jgi:plasmid stability protein
LNLAEQNRAEHERSAVLIEALTSENVKLKQDVADLERDLDELSNQFKERDQLANQLKKERVTIIFLSFLLF